MKANEHTVVANVERLNLKELRLWVREGWVLPAQSASGPEFDEVDIARVRLLCDLKKDMSLSSDALPVVLSLIDRLNHTRRELRTLTLALSEQPEDVRHTVVAQFREMHGTMHKVSEDH